MDLNNLISPEYRTLQKVFHEQRADYGTSGRHYAGVVRSLIHHLGIRSILDYGCGKGTLFPALARLNPPSVWEWEYDPCIPEKAELPEAEYLPVDLVVCTDVMEHVEEPHLPAVLAHIASLGRYAYITIATRPAKKVMPDGRNAHITLMPATQWLGYILDHFNIVKWDVDPGGVAALLTPRSEEALKVRRDFFSRPTNDIPGEAELNDV